MRTVRFTLLAVIALLVTVGPSPATAATRPLFTDPRGDALSLEPGMDVLSAGLYTTGTTKRVGKRTVYTPTHLVAFVTLAGPPHPEAGQSIHLLADLPTCSRSSVSWRSGNTKFSGSQDYITVNGSCRPSAPVVRTITGNTVTWRAQLKAIQRWAEVGYTRFTNFRVYSEQGELLFGDNPNPSNFLTDDTGVDLALDTARSSVTYTLR